MTAVASNSHPIIADSAIGLWGAGFARMVADWLAYRRTKKALQRLSGRQLEDIGLNRADIELAARRSR